MADLTLADVEAIQQYLRTAREDVMTWLPPEWVPAWQSAATAELHNSEVGDGGVPWGEDPVRSAYATAQIFIYATIDCLGGLADSTNLLSTAYLSHVIARAAMEAGSQAWWLLEPKIGARRRVIRSVLVRAQSAKYLEKAAQELDPVNGHAANYGEDPAKAAAYAKTLGLVCNNVKIKGAWRWTCETETLPTYTQRATEFQRHVFAPAAYAIYSGAAHAELYAVAQAWRESAASNRWELNPNREVVWAAAIVGAGFATIPALQAMQLLGKRARGVDFHYHVRNLNSLIAKMDLPRHWRP